MKEKFPFLFQKQKIVNNFLGQNKNKRAFHILNEYPLIKIQKLTIRQHRFIISLDIRLNHAQIHLACSAMVCCISTRKGSLLFAERSPQLGATSYDDLVTTTWEEVIMTANIDSTSIPTCNTADAAASTFSTTPLSFELPVLRDMCASVPGMTLDHVYLVLVAIDEVGGRRELGDLVDLIDDARWPLQIIDAMIDFGFIRFAAGSAFDASIPVERVC